MRISPLLAAVLVISCTAQPGPVLSGVNPPDVFAEFGGPVALEGEGFWPAGVLDFDRPDATSLETRASASLEREGQSAPLLDVTWRSARVIEAKVPPGLPLGRWTVRLTTPRGVTLTLADALQLSPFVTDAGLLLDGGLPDGGFDAGVQPCETYSFRDEDGDGLGAPDSGAFLCGPGRAPDAGDCNDLDALTRTGGVELCNGLDDDCDGVVDDRPCADAGLRALPDLAGPNNDFFGAGAWAPEQLWVTGGTKLFVRGADGGFTDESTNCPMGMNIVWPTPDGGAFVGGGNNGVGRLTTARRGRGCVTAELLPEPVVGLVGFPAADGGVRAEVVLRDGRRIAWDGVTLPLVIEGTALPADTSLVDAHASASGAFFAVGGTNGPPQRPAVFRMDFGGQFIPEELPAGLPDGWLRGVWTLSPFEAVAVGDQGMVIRRRFGRWESVLAPVPTGYAAVRAFSVGRFYAVSDGGLLQQWSGGWSSRAPLGRPVRDLDGVDEEHLWLVGDDGLVVKGAPLP